MMNLWSAALFSLLAVPSLAAVTPRIGLSQPAHGSTNWDVPLNANFGILDSSAAVQARPNTFTSSNTFLGALLASGTSFALTGSAGFITSASSITASEFFGSGAGLTGISAGQITGTFSAAVLPSTVAYTTVANTFVASQTVTAAGGLKVNFGVSVGSMSITDGLTGSSATFTASGNTQFSLQTSSGIRINAGGLQWADGRLSTTTVIPAGASGTLQFNNGGFFGGATQVFWDGTFLGVGRTATLQAQLDIGNPTSSTDLIWRNSGGTAVGTLFASTGGSGAGEVSIRDSAGSVKINLAGATDQSYHLPTLNLGSSATMPYQLGVTGDASITGEVLASSAVLSGNFFSVGASTLVVNNGNVGIGTTTASTDLNVVQKTGVAGINVDYYNSNNVGTAVVGRKARGTISSPSAVSNGDRLGTFGASGFDGNFLSSSTGNFRIQASENFSSTNHGTDLSFNATPTGSTTTQQVGLWTGSGALSIISSMTATEFFGGIHRSSFTIVPNTTFTNTTFGVCVATVPISVSTNSFIDVRFSGQIQNANNTQSVRLTILVDGAFTAQYGATGITSHNIGTINGSNIGMGFAQVIDTPLAFGTHNVCLAPDVTGGTGSIITNATEKSRFGVIEIR